LNHKDDDNNDGVNINTQLARSKLYFPCLLATATQTRLCICSWWRHRAPTRRHPRCWSRLACQRCWRHTATTCRPAGRMRRWVPAYELVSVVFPMSTWRHKADTPANR